MSNDDIGARPNTTTHGTPDVLDDGDTARVVSGEGVAADVRHDGDQVLDDGETAGVVEADGPPKAP